MLAWLAALLIVGAACLALSVAGTWVVLWAVRAVRLAPVAGAAGVALTAAAAVNVLVPRTCDGDAAALPERNRPAISAFAGDGRCQRLGLAQVEAVLILGVGTSAVVHLTARRRRAPGAPARQ